MVTIITTLFLQWLLDFWRTLFPGLLINCKHAIVLKGGKANLELEGEALNDTAACKSIEMESLANQDYWIE